MIIKKSDIPQLLMNNVTGKIGGVVFSKRYGKTVISALPANYKKSNSERAVNNRKRFAVISNIATALNNVPEFKELWKGIAKNKMSSQNAAAKYIARQVGKDGNTEITSIFPADFSLLDCSLVEKNKSGFSVNVDFTQAIEYFNSKNAAGKASSPGNKNNSCASDNLKFVKIAALFIMRNSDFYTDRYKVISSEFLEVDGSKNGMIIEINLYGSDSQMLSVYSNIDVKYVAMLYNSDKSLLHVSGTHSIKDY